MEFWCSGSVAASPWFLSPLLCDIFLVFTNPLPYLNFPWTVSRESHILRYVGSGLQRNSFVGWHSSTSNSKPPHPLVVPSAWNIPCPPFIIHSHVICVSSLACAQGVQNRPVLHRQQSSKGYINYVMSQVQKVLCCQDLSSGERGWALLECWRLQYVIRNVISKGLHFKEMETVGKNETNVRGCLRRMSFKGRRRMSILWCVLRPPREPAQGRSSWRQGSRG